MMISHKWEFVFVKTMKTGSTSVEVALSDFCGPGDIYTPVSEGRLRDDRGVPRHRNHRRPPKGPARTQWRSRPREQRRPTFRNHMPAVAIRAIIGHELWDRYLTFAVERNPWDKAVSHYFWNTRHATTRPDFRDWLTNGGLRRLRTMKAYSDDGRIIVERVLRYENLEVELRAVAAELGLPGVPRLPDAKAGVRPQLHYRDVHDDVTRDLVAKSFHREIELFGYEF